MFRTTALATAAAALMAFPMAASADDIVDTAIANGNFTTLIAAVQAAGLEETLRGDGPFTVFAPTDEAFAALPEGTVEALLADIEALTAILTYHVVPMQVTSMDLSEDTPAATVNGEALTFDLSDGVRINDTALVTLADVQTSNGVIHVIDAVLIP